MESRNFDITVLSHRLHVRRLHHSDAARGPAAGDRPVIIMLHEALGCVEMWHDFPEKLAFRTGCDVMLYDRLGHGRSDILPPAHVHESYLYDESWQVLPRVLDACGIRQGLFWGHSDGGTMALLFGAAFPGRVGAIVTEAAHVYVDGLTTAGIKQAVTAWETRDLKKKLEKYHGANAGGIFHRWSRVWLSQTFARWNVIKYLERVHAPILAIQGESDHYGEPGQVAAITGHAGGRAESLFIPECGHAPHHQATEAVLSAAKSFASSL